jgi:predicted NBD/HSP70 family sugar kinase
MGKPEIVLDLLALEIVDALNCARELGRRVVDVTVIAFAPVAGEPAIVLADTDLDWGPTDVVAELRARVAAIDDLARHRADAVSLVGDTPLAATAEHDASELGGAMLYIKSDSGIGGALVTADGNALTGEHGFGGAFGHLAVDYTGARCLCGQRGCLVTVAGPDVLLDRVGLSDVAGRDGLSLALEKFVDRILDGDPVAVRVWAEAEEWIARTLSILALAFDPASIVIGGYWAQFSNGIAERIGNSRPTRNSLDVLPPLPVRPGVFGADAALRGALDAARERIFRDPFAYA